MKLAGVNGEGIELSVAGYALHPADGTDRNRLSTCLTVHSGFGKNWLVQLSLLTWELRAAIGWFRLLAQGGSLPSRQLVFADPNLSFEVTGRATEPRVRIRLRFGLEPPPHPPRQAPSTGVLPHRPKVGQPYFVDLLADDVELRRIASELEQELARYPERT